MTISLSGLLSPVPPSKFLDGPLVIYGAGNKGREVYRCLTERGHIVTALLDTHATPGQAWNGIPIETPEEWLARNQAAQFSAVVSIHNYSVEMPPLLAAIERMDFRQVVNIVELYNLMPAGTFPNHYWLAPASFYAPFGTEVETLGAELADTKSRDILEAVLAFRLGGDYSRLPPPQLGDQYRPADLPRWKNPVRFIDCGAFDGDTLAHLARDGYRFDAITAFEPDPASFRVLARAARRFGPSQCFPCGLAAATELRRFNAAQSMASHLASDGDTVIQCVAIDEALADFRPTLIKMDIEGAELDALLGARETIMADRPALAISLYHHPAHLWQIPLLIARWDLGYRLYLRAHAHNTYELVLYAIPD